MGHRVTRFPTRGSGHRRLNAWVGPPEQGFVTVVTTGSTLISSLSVEEATTIIRTRGMIAIQVAMGASLEVIGAVGIGIVSTEAFGIGITAIPTPYSDADWHGWLMWESFGLAVDFDDATGSRFNTLRIDVDSKGMRKVAANETLVMIAESQTGAFQVADATRQLFKLL